ncbi:fungal specific transcription factor domain-containing protein [Colletotrichum truncatum]|uniref:Fungal specific transcription factor domain-containing protein n=1 Tax=Colletotrichum truncatum TaxID=5467 RepID=A0ACC3YZY7_COLTU|nr:fungal specific transcription factor domain-containing protein [Colletotrichum truncatum]KAF6800839.1 fungal specific transcription factor domain-containing protein [Colletotrichum truncatum]
MDLPSSDSGPVSVPPASPVGNTATTKPRSTRGKYISKACYECRKRKSKCNGRSPCLRCARQSLTCTYPVSKKQREHSINGTDGDAQAIRSLREQIASLQGDLSLLRQQSSHQMLQSPAQSTLPVDDTPHVSGGRLISPDYSDPSSRLPRSDQNISTGEANQVQDNRQSSASYTFNINLARSHLRAQGIAMIDQDKQGATSSAERTRPPSPSLSNQLPLELDIGSVDPLWLIDEKEAIRLCNIYEVEIGIQYPFLDMPQLIDKVRSLYRAMSRGSQNGFAFTSMPGPTVIDPQDLDLVKLIISVASVVEAGGSSQLGRKLFLGVRKSSHDKLWEPAGIKNTMIFVLLAIYSFMTGDDLQAWRLVGVSARWCLEVGLHQSSTVKRLFKDLESRKVALRLFWCVYTLDRRWGFGAGLPFVIHHCDVDESLPEPGDDIPYLKAMVTYSQIGNKVWSTSYNSARTTGAVREDEVSYLQYLIDKWYEELPEELRLSPNWESKEWTETSRGPQRLELLLHLRANQMKILLLQPVLQSSSSFKENKTKVQSLIDRAKDTIQKLSSLNRSTDIYQTQQMCFNHFLVSALGVIFLVVALAPSEYGAIVRDEFHLALDLIRGLSAKSYVSSRLWKMVGDLRLAWRKLGLNTPIPREDRHSAPQHGLVVTPPLSSSGVDVSLTSRNAPQLGSEEIRNAQEEPWRAEEPTSNGQMAQDLSDFFNAMDSGGDLLSPYPVIGSCGESIDASGDHLENSLAPMIDISQFYVDML